MRGTRGELAPGAWGEGFIDRRHPHTYVHEFMLTAADLLAGGMAARTCRSRRVKGSCPSGPTTP